MATIVTRSGKGSALTHAEGDANFTNLNTDKAETSALAATDAALAAHLVDAVDAHDASAISNVPAGSITSLTLQAAVNELDSKKVPETDFTAFGKTLVDDADRSALKTTVGLQVDGLTALQALTPGTEEIVYLTYRSSIGDGGEGTFIWDSSNLSTQVTADAQKVVYVPPTTDTTGASGAWVRQFSGDVKVTWSGASEAASASANAAAIQGALNYGADVDFCGLSLDTDTVYPLANQRLYNGGLISQGTTGIGLAVIYATGKSGIKIDHLSITQDAGVLASAANRGIYCVSGNNIVVDNCYIEGFGREGVRFDGCLNGKVTDNVVINCFREAEGSVDDSLAYGSIGIYGESNKSNRCLVRNNYVFTNSTGISIAGGTGNSIIGNQVIANSSVSAVAMGIYTLETLTKLQIKGNFVSGFPNEGIDVHNTGATPRSGVSGITITENVLTTNSYVGISVVSSSTFEITDVVISDNQVIADSNGTTFGFSHGILCDYVISANIDNNRVILATTTPTDTSYGIYAKNGGKITMVGNNLSAAFTQNIRTEDIEDVILTSSNISVKASGYGIAIVTGTKSRFAITGNNIIGTDATSVLLGKITGGIALQYASITGNSFSVGTITIGASQHLVFVGNMCVSLTGASITDGGQGLIGFNKGYLDTIAGTTKTTPSTVDQWLPVLRNGVQYYMPMYTSTTT